MQRSACKSKINPMKRLRSHKAGKNYRTGSGKHISFNRKILAAVAACIIILCIVLIHHASVEHRYKEESMEKVPDFITVDLLDVNSYSRPGIALKKVNGIVIHYTANPGSSAKENRDYFNNLQNTHLTKASAHFIVGLNGEVIQCIPTREIAYASNQRNYDTISIECCYRKQDGSFQKKTYRSLIHLTAWLCRKYGLSASDVIRHYDVTGKLCPKYYVSHPDKWKQLKKDVSRELRRMQ